LLTKLGNIQSIDMLTHHILTEANAWNRKH